MSAARELPGIDDPALLIRDIVDVTPQWLGNLLRTQCGIEVEVGSLTISRIGNGQIGASYRVVPDYVAAAPSAPPSLVIKLAAGTEAQRALMSAGYAWEIGFYQQLAQRLAIRTARCWHAAISTDQRDFTLVMDDLAPAVPGSQSVGCDLPRARNAIRNLAGLHAPLWNDPILRGGLAWLQPLDADGTALIVALYEEAVETFIDRYAAGLGPAAETLRHTKGFIERWLMEHQQPFSVIHGDYRLDNLMFAPDTDAVTALDWQTTSVGHPLRDVAYFIALSMPPELRREREGDLVVGYHRALLDRGVTDFGWEDCWTGYRLGMLQGPLITVLGCVFSGAERTSDSDAMFLSMATRSCAAIRDLGSLDLSRW